MREDTDVEARLTSLWGSVDMPVDAGVLHVVATWFDGEAHRVLRISATSPKSDTDFFLLNLARARADVIITTGRILREEPTLAYELPATWAAAMVQWRSRVLGRDTAPRVAVLTSGRDLDPSHPTFHGWAKPVVVTSQDASRAVRAKLPGHVDVIGLQSTDAAAVIHWARSEGARTVSIEAGPSTARALYADSRMIDELSWSQYLDASLGPQHHGPALWPSEPDALGLSRLETTSRLETSGRWRFSRWRRATHSGTTATDGRAG